MTIDLPVRTFQRVFGEDAIKLMIAMAQSKKVTDEQIEELAAYKWKPTPIRGTIHIPDDVVLKVARISEELCFHDAPIAIRKYLTE